MMRVIACGNQKGGVGKSTASLNLSYALANKYKQKVLLIDMDSQGSSSLNLGIDVSSDEINTIDKLLEPYVIGKTRRFSWEAVKSCIYTPVYWDRERDTENKMKWVDVQKPFGFDVIPSSLQLAIVELQMGIMGGRSDQRSIRMDYLEGVISQLRINSDYDYVVIDTPPSLASLSVNSIYSARDGVVVVSNTDIMSLRGVDTFIESTEMVQSRNPGHRGVLGIMMCLYSERRKVDRDLEDWAKGYLPIPTFNTRIPETADVKKANSSMLLVSQVNKKMKKAFEDAAYEIMYAIEHPDAKVGNAAISESDGEE